VSKTGSLMKKEENETSRASFATISRATISRLTRLRWTSWFLLLAILFFAALRFRLRDAPLERDEGEYAYAGQLILKGIPPYQQAYNMKLPGTYAAYALVLAIFGQSSAGIHLGLIFINAATSLLVFGIAKNLFGNRCAAFAGVSYAALSASPALFGIAGHATHFVVIAAAAGLLLLLHAVENGRATLLLASGLCLGLAFLMKQPGIFFCAFGLLYLIYREWTATLPWKAMATHSSILAAGMALPFALTCLVLYWMGVFRSFWFWTFSYARAYGGIVTLHEGLHELQNSGAPIFTENAGFYLLAALGFVLLFRDVRARRHWLFIAGLLIFSFAAVSAGLFFRPHYFILLLPAMSLLVGIAVETTTQALETQGLGTFVVAIPAVVFGLAFFLSVFEARSILLAPDSVTACRRLYRGNPFPEARQLAELLKTSSPPDARIAVFGSEPEIFFYAQRRSATGYIYMYSLMEDQAFATQMQQQMINEVTASHPEFAVFVDDGLSWLFRPGQSREAFLRWIQQFLNAGYEQIDHIDIHSETLAGTTPRLYLYRRKPN